jgi:hypothetical protein
MTDKSTPASSDAIATGLLSDLGLLRQTILSQANIPVPALSVCLSRVQGLIQPGFTYASYEAESHGKPRDKEQITAEKTKVKEALLAHQSKYVKLSVESNHLIREHAQSLSAILLYAKYLHEFEASKNDLMVKKYQYKYLQAKKDLRDKLGDRQFAGLMHDLMKSSQYNDHKHFGIIFHADSYCEPEFQNIADVANTVNLTNLAKMPEMPKKVKVAPNLFGSNRDYHSVPLASGLGHILLPTDPKQDNTVFVVCPGLEKLARNPAQILAQLQGGGGVAVFNQIQEQIQALNLPKGWKANIKVVGDNMGAKIAEEYFTAIQQGLRGELGPVTETLKKAALQHVQGKAEEFAKKAGLGAGVEVLGQLGGAQGLAQHIGGLNFQNVQTSPLLSANFRASNPQYDRFLTKAKIPQNLGTASLVLGLAQDLGLDKVAEKILAKTDHKLMNYHKYRVIRPGLKFVAENALPVAGYVAAGAALGAPIAGIGAGAGALIGLGVGVGITIFKGFSLWKKKKQERMQREADERGMEMQSSFQDLGAVYEHAPSPTVRFSSQPSQVSSQATPNPNSSANLFLSEDATPHRADKARNPRRAPEQETRHHRPSRKPGQRPSSV